MDDLLAGKNALITGAGRNIGRSIAIEMAGQGANIFFTDTDKEKCISLERELSKYRVVSKGLISDVSKTEDTDSLFNYLLENNIRVDILVNNVGVHDTKVIKKLDLKEWRKVFDTNILGPIYLTKLISQMMINNDTYGSIMFITSIHQWTIRRFPAYSASKAALGMIISRKETCQSRANNYKVKGFFRLGNGV